MGAKSKIIKPFLILTSIIFILLFVMILQSIISLDLFQTFKMTYIYTAYFILFFLWLDKSRRFSLNMVVIYYMFFQAAGLPLAYVVNPEYTLLRLNRSKMFYGLYIDRYIALSLLALTCIILVFIFSKNSKKYSYEIDFNNIEKRTNVYYEIGMTLLLLFTIYMSFNYIVGNIPIGNYESYKNWANSSRIRNYLQIGYWISSILICSTTTKKKIGIATIIFLIPSTILFLAGNRNDVLFPLLIGFGIYVYRFRKVPKFVLIIIIITLLVISPMIVSLRNGAITFQSVSDNIAISLAELGSQLTAVSHMFTWLDAGEDYAWGLTYLYGAIGALFGPIFSELRPLIEDSRYWISGRVSTLGFAMSAEVYFNFGLIGLLLTYCLVGYYFVKNENKKRNVDELIIYGAIIFYLLFLVRNSFGYSIAYAVIFVVVYLFEKIIRKNFYVDKKL